MLPGKPHVNERCPNGRSLPAPHRRLNRVCRPAYLGRKRGEVGRSRTTVLQATTHQWIGTYAAAGNGDYRGELKRALEATTRYATALALPVSQVLIRLDGLYGNAAPVTDVLHAGCGLLARSRDYALLDQPEIQARFACPPDAESTHPESGTYRALYDCPDIALTPTGPRAPDRGYPSRFIHERLHWEAARRAGVRIVCDSTSFSRIFSARRA